MQTILPPIQWGNVTLVLDQRAFEEGYTHGRQYYFEDAWEEQTKEGMKEALMASHLLGLIAVRDERGFYRYHRKAEKRLKRLHRELSRKQKKSANRKKARKQLAKAYLKVQRQREDFARKTASALVTSHDLIAYEDLQIRNMVRNRHLSKSINDASWGKFLGWVKYYAALHQIVLIAVAPHFTSQDCSCCGTRVKKSLSVRTHICLNCGLMLDRDANAAQVRRFGACKILP